MKFVALMKFKKKPTKEIIAQNIKLAERLEKEDDIKIISIFWTLGRYDAVITLEAPDEKAVMRLSIRTAEVMTSETMVAIPAEEADKLVE